MRERGSGRSVFSSLHLFQRGPQPVTDLNAAPFPCDKTPPCSWPCDPNGFESSIVYPVEVNDETHSLAFRVEFRTQGFLPRDEAVRSSAWLNTQYVYIY